jgi:Rod binding domain-containing protein
MNSISSVHLPAAEDPKSAKALRAGTQFEAVLLNAVFGGLQSAFTHLPGGGQRTNSTQSYDAIAMQALTSGISHAGGIGLGALVGRWLAARTKG